MSGLGLGFMFQGLGFGAQGSGFRVQGLAFRVYRGTSLIRNSLPQGPYSRTVSRALCWS